MSNYFRRLPDFEYISRLNDRTSNNDYVTVKNIFRRALIREDLLITSWHSPSMRSLEIRDLTRLPMKSMETQTLIGLFLLLTTLSMLETNEHMSQFQFEKYIIQKYGSFENANEVKHYETIEIKDSSGKVHIPKGRIVSSDFTTSFTDSLTNVNVTSDPASLSEITYYVHEERLQNERRNINILKSKYLPRVLDEIETLLDYEPSTEFISPKLKKASNPNFG